VLGADGSVETITGTMIHPVWSVDRQEWVPLGELAQGEGLCCDTESFGLGFHSSLPPKASGLVLSVTLSRVSQPVYNIEVHGEHVYQVGELGVVVHNSCEGTIGTYGQLRKLIKGSGLEAHHLIEKRFKGLFGESAGKMLSQVLNPETHQAFTNAWRKLIPYGEGTANATRETVLNAAREVYKEFPDILKALGL